jgi:hypothetical protein
MKKFIAILIAVSFSIFVISCGEGDKKKESEISETEVSNDANKESEDDSGESQQEMIKEESSSDNNDTSSDRVDGVRLEFSGFINKTYTNAIDIFAQQTFKEGPLMISISFEDPEKGGGSVAFTTKFEKGTYEMKGGPMSAASVAAGKYIYKSTGGNVTITSLDGGFATGTISNVTFKEETEFNGGDLKLVSGSFKVPLTVKKY